MPSDGLAPAAAAAMLAPMSERLAELQRQRTKLYEQLAAVEQLIAAELGGATQPAAPVPTPAPASSASTPPLVSSTGAGEGESERILSHYRAEPEAMKNDLRKGCFVYMAVGFGLFSLAALALYFYSRMQHLR